MYHITPIRNVPSILRSGIIPNYRYGIGLGRKFNNIFLTDNVQYIIMHQTGLRWLHKEKAIILKVDCNNLEINPVVHNITGLPVISPHEFVVTGIIHPNRIIEIDCVIH